MNPWDWVDTLNSVSAFFLGFFSVFLLTHKKGKPASNRALALLLLAMALGLMNFVLSRPGRLPSSFLPLFLCLNVPDFLWGPLLFFYVQSVAYRDFAWRKRHLLHALPMVAYVVFLLATTAVSPRSLSDINALRSGVIGMLGMRLFASIVTAQLIAYLGASLWTLRSYRARLDNVFSSPDKFYLGWLSLFLGNVGLIWVIGAVNQMATVVTRRGAPSLILSIATMLITFGLAHLIVFRGLKQPEIFSGLEAQPKYEQFRLTQDEERRILDDLGGVMEREKPHLTFSLSVGDLAKKIKVRPRALSQVINSRLRKNFLDYINSYRVEEAKKLLSAADSRDKTLLEVAFDSGFNTKSVFNRAFKKHARMTPKNYRQKFAPSPAGDE